MTTATTWVSAGSTDANNAANYSAGLPADAAVTLDATSVIDWIFTADMSVEQVTIAAAYTGVVTMTGFDLVCSEGFSDDGTTGAHTYGDLLQCDGNSATVHFGSTLGVVTASSCTLTMNGVTAMVIDCDKIVVFNSLVLGANAVVVNSGATGGGVHIAFYSTGTPLTMGNNSTLTANQEINFQLQISGNVHSIGVGCVLNGSAPIEFRAGTNNVTVTVPTTSYTGTGDIILDCSTSGGPITGWSHTLSGNISVGANLYIRQLGAGGYSGVFNGSSYNVTAKNLYVGNNQATSTYTVNFGSGLWTLANYYGHIYNQVTTINLQSATFTIDASVGPAFGWLYGSNHTVNPGTSQVTITGNSTVTSNGKSFYALIINGAGITITLADTLTIANGGTLWVINFTAFAGNQYIVFAGSGGITISVNVSNRLRTAVAGSTIIWNTGVNTWTFPAYTANDWGGTVGNRVSWVSSASGTQYNIAAPAPLVNVSYMRFQDANNSTGSTIYANDGTSQNGGNNVNIIFPATLTQRAGTESKIAISCSI